MSGDYDPPNEKIYFSLQCYNCNSWQSMHLDFVGNTAYKEHDPDFGGDWWVSFKKYVGTCPNCQAHQEMDLEVDREEM